MTNGGCDISVCVRVKPSSDHSSCIQVLSEQSILINDPLSVFSPPLVPVQFNCDYVLREDQDTSAVVDSLFRECIEFHPTKGLSVRNVLALSCGHSGSGKTHTIFGSGGFVDLWLQKMAAELAHHNSTAINMFTVSFLEVYNEKVYDLLSPETSSSPLPLLETKNKELVVKGLTRVETGSVQELCSLIGIGLENRIESKNAIHANSSRSHAILQIDNTALGLSVWFVDLAGSERLQTRTVGGKNTATVQSIHKSLHSLRRCIMTLGGLCKNQQPTLLPVRESVLTRILFSKKITYVALIACVDPNPEYVQETLNTIEFASCGLRFGGTEKCRWSGDKRLVSPEKAAPTRILQSDPKLTDLLSPSWRYAQYDEIIHQFWLRD